MDNNLIEEVVTNSVVNKNIDTITIEQYDIDRMYKTLTIITNGKNEGCWQSTLCKNTSGYVNFSIDGGRFIAGHRFMYKIFHMDEHIHGLSICHTCDNRWCLNPEHLFVGTHQDNMRDMVLKNRNAKGSQISLSKLNENQVKNILDDILQNKYKWVIDICNKYDMSECTIGQIINGKIWKHVTKDYDLKLIKNIIMSDRIGVNNCNARFSEDDVRDIRKRIKNGETGRSIAKIYNCDQTSISEIGRGKTYRNVI